MSLIKISERIYVLPYSADTDRPNLFYINGDDFSVAVDAGNSINHSRLFYDEIEKSGLRRPEYTIITHWHWDHTFGIAGLDNTVISTTKTIEILNDVKNWKWDIESMNKRLSEGKEIAFCHENILKEYPDLNRIKVKLPDVGIDKEMVMGLGGITVHLIPKVSTHTLDSLFVYIPEEDMLIVADADCEDFYHGAVYEKERLNNMIEFFKSLDYKYHWLSHALYETKEEALKRLEGIYAEL